MSYNHCFIDEFHSTETDFRFPESKNSRFGLSQYKKALLIVTDVHIKRNIISADYAVVPDMLIHFILKGKILTVEEQLEPLMSTTLLRPSIHLSTVCDLCAGSNSIAVLNCHSSVYCAKFNAVLQQISNHRCCNVLHSVHAAIMLSVPHNYQ